MNEPSTPRSIEIAPSILYFGTPVALISTVDDQGRANLSPISSAWALGDRLVLGMASEGQGWMNLQAQREAVINLPGPGQCAQVEALAPTTGRDPVPAYKVEMGYRFERDKFRLAGFTPVPSKRVTPPRIAECPLQIEARLLVSHPASAVNGEAPGFMLIEMQALQVHAHEAIVVAGTQHIDTGAWSPLLYVFRHYFGTAARLGRNFRAEH